MEHMETYKTAWIWCSIVSILRTSQVTFYNIVWHLILQSRNLVSCENHTVATWIIQQRVCNWLASPLSIHFDAINRSHLGRNCPFLGVWVHWVPSCRGPHTNCRANGRSPGSDWWRYESTIFLAIWIAGISPEISIGLKNRPYGRYLQ